MSESGTAPLVIRAQHSPGPWKACQNGECPCGHTWSIPDDFPVCTVLNEGGINVRHAVAIVHTHMADAPDIIYATLSAERAKANLHLIAAAPELFEALKALCEVYEHGADNEQHENDVLDDALAALRAATEGRITSGEVPQGKEAIVPALQSDKEGER